MLSTDLSILELEALIGPMEPIPCEHLQHEIRPKLHDGPAVEYVRGSHSCGYKGPVRPVCQKWVDHAKTNVMMHCPNCREVDWSLTLNTFLGPINGRSA